MGDAAIAAATAFIIFNWGKTKEAAQEVVTATDVIRAKKRDYLRMYREHGVDMVEAEKIRDELERRGLSKDEIPSLDEARDAAEIVAELHMMLDETPYVIREAGGPSMEGYKADSKMDMWPRQRDLNDGQ